MTSEAVATQIDPITFEILHHRLSMIVDEAAQVLRDVSPSPVASEVADCNVALMDADGNAIVIGPLIPGHDLSAANSVKYILSKFREVPGIADTPPPSVVATGMADAVAAVELRYWVDEREHVPDTVKTAVIAAALRALVQAEASGAGMEQQPSS